jgi:hypothetical protein
MIGNIVTKRNAMEDNMANKYEKKYAPALQRAREWADKIGIPAPSRVVDEDGTPAKELLAFCRVTNITLDHIYCGAQQTREVYSSGKVTFLRMVEGFDQNELDKLSECMRRMIELRGKDTDIDPLEDFKVWHAEYLAHKTQAA